MPTKKISELNPITPLGTDLVVLDRPTVGAGFPTTGHASLADVQTLIVGGVAEYWDSEQNAIIHTTGSALVGGIVTASLGFTGSLTKLTDGSDYLRAGSGIDISTGSQGEVTIAVISGGTGLSTGKQYVAPYSVTNSTSSQVIGQFSWVPTDYSSLTQVELRAIMATDGTTNLTGSLQVYNLTSGSFLDLTSAPTNKHLPFTGSNPTLFSSDNLLAAGTNFNNSANSVYEVRVSGSSADTLVVGGVELVFG